MGTTAGLEPYGRALRDFHRGSGDATLMMYTDLGEAGELPASLFFRGPEDYFAFDELGLELARGRVLDVGGGTGVHAAPLQQRGLDVTVLEILPLLAEILRERGIQDVREIALQDFHGETYDTVLCLMNGTGPFETLAGLDSFLHDAPRLLRPGGQVIIDSAKVERTQPPLSAPPIEWPAPSESYVGEAWIVLEYDGKRGEPFRELYVDFKTLEKHCLANGWRCELIFDGEGDDEGFVARLTRSGA